MPRPEFPRSLPEFFDMFPDEQACLRFVMDSRWPDGVLCPRCGDASVSPRRDRRGGLECSCCSYTFSAMAGTVMARTKLPLSTWLRAAYLAVTDKRGISAMQLRRDLGLKGYETAYTLLQRLRAAMVDPARGRLTEFVEVDETFLGGVKHGRPGRRAIGGPGGKFIVLGAVEVRVRPRPTDGLPVRRPARLRLRHVDDARWRTVRRFLEDVVEEGAVVATDGNPVYDRVGRHGRVHEVQSTARGLPQDGVLPHLHLAFSNLKAWLAGTFHGAVEAKHLQGYLDEFCFRFNRRDDLFASFQTTLGIGSRVPGPTNRDLFGNRPGGLVPTDVHPSRTHYPLGLPSGGR